jgi:hypothetical protein
MALVVTGRASREPIMLPDARRSRPAAPREVPQAEDAE